METSPDKIAELRVKYFEMIQAAICRLSAYNATLKNYCITLTTAVCGFAITIHKPSVILLALLPILVLAVLDAQYLRAERRFRSLYSAARMEKDSEMPSFDMDISKIKTVGFWGAVFSWSVSGFYSPIVVGIIALLVVVSSVPK